jgi:hypothetical protein
MCGERVFHGAKRTVATSGFRASPTCQLTKEWEEEKTAPSPSLRRSLHQGAPQTTARTSNHDLMRRERQRGSTLHSLSNRWPVQEAPYAPTASRTFLRSCNSSPLLSTQAPKLCTEHPTPTLATNDSLALIFAIRQLRR